jgi:hypothetical protein
MAATCRLRRSNGPWLTTGAPSSSRKDRIQALKSVIQADFAGRHAEGEAEVARQRRRLARLEHERAKAKTAYYEDALTLDEFKLEQERIGHEVKAANEAIARWTIEVDAMGRALDEALSLLTDPYRLYTEAPDGINLMLVQAICEKVWILDTGVVGLDLTAPFAELLTVEARLALADDPAQPGQTSIPTHREEMTYYRRARGLAGLLRDLEQSWPRLQVERHYGPLPLEHENPASARQGSDVLLLVPPAGFEPAHPAPEAEELYRDSSIRHPRRHRRNVLPSCYEAPCVARTRPGAFATRRQRSAPLDSAIPGYPRRCHLDGIMPAPALRP